MSAEKPVVSVLMSVYNEPLEWVCQSVESILQQTYKDFEFIIICDNPRNNRVRSVINDYEKKDHRIRCFVNEENIGLTKSLNKGLKLCMGKYVARMDADDIALPERLDKQVSFMEENPSVAACSSSVKIINSEGMNIGERRLSTNRKKIAVKSIFASELIHPASIIRKIVDGEQICYDETLRYAQDFGMWSSLPIGSMANLPDILLLYRVTDSQITSQKREEQKTCARAVQIKNLRKNGLELSNKEIRCFDFLINGVGDPSVTSDDIVMVVRRVMLTFEGKLDVKLLYEYLSQRYVWCLNKMGYNSFKKILLLSKLSKSIGIHSVKPLLFVLYLKGHK